MPKNFPKEFLNIWTQTPLWSDMTLGVNLLATVAFMTTKRITSPHPLGKPWLLP